MNPCTKDKRHSWTWMCNIKLTSINYGNGRGTISLRGRYACDCGAKKIGPAQ